MNTGGVLLGVQDLTIALHLAQGMTTVVQSVSWSVRKGQTLAVVGESGSGKSLSALAILRLLPPVAEVTAGQVLFEGRQLLDLTESSMQSVRGRQIAMTFQEPMSALNPVYTVGDQIAECIQVHLGAAAREARHLAIDALQQVRIPDAARRAHEYPHELSGGMQQRVMIAMALACRPSLLIADEPTTALDVTTQAQILELLRDIQARTGIGLLLITHDFGIVAEMADHVCVMRRGEVVEQAAVQALFENPQHPYTQMLMRSVPHLED